jgi:redox-sensitive bicupin YhaK (pirin superfamily)
MITLRKSSDRGYADHGWLKSAHSFSFADYHDPRHMGFGNLRVINEDRITPGSGFGTHGHRDMEIVSYVLDGELAHKDSMGTGSAQGAPSGVIRPGDVQRMSAGSGVRHSEFNHAKDRLTHFCRSGSCRTSVGIPPNTSRSTSMQRASAARLRLVASPDGRDGLAHAACDASIRPGLFDGRRVG